MTRTTELTPLLKSLKLGALAATLPERIAPGPKVAAGLRLIPGNHPQRRGQSPCPSPHRTPAAQCRFRGDLPPGGLRLVGVNYPGSSSAGRRLLPGVSRPARACLAGGPRRCRQELLRPGPGLRRRPRRTYRPFRPRRRLLQSHDPGQSGQLDRPRLPVFPHARPAHPR